MASADLAAFQLLKSSELCDKKHGHEPEKTEKWKLSRGSEYLISCMSLFQLWTQRTDPVLHIELRRWADLLVIAPLDANTLGKIANGICDNLLVRT